MCCLAACSLHISLGCYEFLIIISNVSVFLYWRPKVDVDQVVGALTCPVCLELPRHLPVPVCQNGHTICLTCSRNGLGHCPVCRCVRTRSKLLMRRARCILVSLMVCRDPRPRGVSFLAGRLIQVVPHRCPYQPCNKVVPIRCGEEHIFVLIFTLNLCGQKSHIIQ